MPHYHRHVVEINILEEKHKEEVELWRIQLAQCEEKMTALQLKLQHHTSHKNEIAQKLHSVMETQWLEALKIITAGSPQHGGKVRTSKVANVTALAFSLCRFFRFIKGSHSHNLLIFFNIYRTKSKIIVKHCNLLPACGILVFGVLKFVLDPSVIFKNVKGSFNKKFWESLLLNNN